jgi:cobalt-precorrin 5A hydrolase/precorrin-3B C17-methyltransferase
MSTGDDSTAIFYITERGLHLARNINKLFPYAKLFKFKSQTVTEEWDDHRNLIFIMAAGIVVRTIAPLLKDKKTDPAVVVLDEKGKYAISLLSGHLGGANKLAKEIADFMGGEAAITTASDVNCMPSLDLWAKENNLAIDNWKVLPRISTKLLNNGALKVYTEHEADVNLPDVFSKTDTPEPADLIITNKNKINLRKKGQLYMRPRNIVIGFGCNSGTGGNEIEAVIRAALDENNLAFSAIHSIATIDKKSGEPGLIAFAKRYDLKVKTFSPDELNSVKGVSKSDAAFKATGANAVAEPSALLASGADKLLVKKIKNGNVTVAVTELKSGSKLKNRIGSNANPSLKGKIYIIGTGPGSIGHITPYAQEAIRKSDAIVGYGTYLDLIEGLLKDKEVFSTGMTHEIDRCKQAVELASAGKTVSVISGGDPGIYAMAGLVFELLRAVEQQNSRTAEQQVVDTTALRHYCTTALPDVEVIPGISALNACAARLGAPLMHDFASISLSDRLTPWDLIEKRLEAAAMADFVIVLYNPKSMGRPEHINRAREIIMKHRRPDTPVGIVKAAMRDNEEVTITDLKFMLSHDIDMQTTVIIGNSQTFVWEGRIVTPRGYTVTRSSDR